LFVRLRISKRRKKLATWNFACLFDYCRGRSCLILVNFGSRGVTAAALLQSSGMSYIQIAPGTGSLNKQSNLAREKLCGYRLCVQSELGAAASRKAVWWDLRLPSLLTHLLWPPWVADADIIFCPVISIFLLLLLFFSPNLSGRRLYVYHRPTSTHGVTLVRIWNVCHVWNVLLVARWKYRTQKIAISATSHNFVGPYLRNWRMYRQSEKKLLNSYTSSTCSDNMVNFGPLAAEICWRVWGIAVNFNDFRVLSANLLHGTLVVGVCQTCGVEQRAPPIFGTAAITLGIDPHFYTVSQKVPTS